MPTPNPHTTRPGLTLVPSRPRPHTILALWHLLSLDAPTVATVWTVFLAHSVHITLPWTSPAAMFTAVWMIYAADRLLDARNAPPSELEARHRFHHSHRSAFLSAIFVAAAILIVMLTQLDSRSLRLYTLLATLLGLYLLLIHLRATANRLPKELAVGIFFPAAVFIPTVARAPGLRLELLPIAALFAAVCTLNCLFLYAWEHPSQRSAAHATTRWATSHLPHLALATIFFTLFVHQPKPPALACALSATLLLLLHLNRHHLRPINLRAAADLTLLTPLLFLAF